MGAGGHTQKREGFRFDLTDALPRQAEWATRCLERLWRAATNSVSQLNDEAFTAGQGIEHERDCVSDGSPDSSVKRIIHRRVAKSVIEVSQSTVLSSTSLSVTVPSGITSFSTASSKETGNASAR